MSRSFYFSNLTVVGLLTIAASGSARAQNVNIQFAPGTATAFTGTGALSDGGTTWNQVGVGGAATVTKSNLNNSAGTATSVGVSITNVGSYTNTGFPNNPASDATNLQSSYAYTDSAHGTEPISITGLKNNELYNVYTYGVGDANSQASSFTVGGTTKSTTGGNGTAHTLTLGQDYQVFSNVAVSSGTLSLNYAPNTANSNTFGPVNGLQIQDLGISSTSTLAYAVVAGGTSTASSVDGVTYAADQANAGTYGFTGTGTSAASNGTPSVDGSKVAFIKDASAYTNQRYGANFGYSFNVGTSLSTYAVALGFDEHYDGTVGQRQSNITINGTIVKSNFDVLAAAGGEDKATELDFFNVTPVGGLITVGFIGGQNGASDANAFVDAIQIIRTSTAAAPEPGAFALLGFGAAALAGGRWRKARRG